MKYLTSLMSWAFQNKTVFNVSEETNVTVVFDRFKKTTSVIITNGTKDQYSKVLVDGHHTTPIYMWLVGILESISTVVDRKQIVQAAQIAARTNSLKRPPILAV